MDLLDRVIGRIFRAGLMMQAARADGTLDSDPEGALGRTVDDVHAMLTIWTSASRDPDPRHPIDELATVIAHLRAAAATLSRLVAKTADGSDGVRFAAINDADRIVCCALIMLLDAYAAGLTSKNCPPLIASQSVIRFERPGRRASS